MFTARMLTAVVLHKNLKYFCALMLQLSCAAGGEERYSKTNCEENVVKRFSRKGKNPVARLQRVYSQEQRGVDRERGKRDLLTGKRDLLTGKKTY